MFLKKRKHKKKYKKFYKIKAFILCLFFLFIFGLYGFIVQFESEIVPTAIAIGQKYSTNMINQEINNSVEKVIENLKVSSSDLFTKNINNNTNINYLDVDTILINNICSKISEELSKRLKDINKTIIPIPIGVFTGKTAFSSLGPKFSVSVTSIGGANVGYETSFESVGINQINFQVFLNIDTSISIVNPMYKKDLNISRKITLVNTVFNGEVPNAYLNMK